MRKREPARLDFNEIGKRYDNVIRQVALLKSMEACFMWINM